MNRSIALQMLIALPLLVLLSYVGWVLFGALPGVALSPDLMPWLAELPFITCYALATLVAAMAAMQVTGMNICNADRTELLRRAAGGNRDAYRVVRHESWCWFAMLVLAAFYFWPAR